MSIPYRMTAAKRLRDNCPESEYWNKVGKQWAEKQQLCGPLDAHSKSIHLRLLGKWADIANSQRVLKTDLFEEAFRIDQLLFDMASINSNIVGIDISSATVHQARTRSRGYGADSGDYICCDVRQLPFAADSFDLVLSTSTLDHFQNEMDIDAALKELWRVLQPGGTLILTLDNKTHLTYPPYWLIRLWMSLGLAPYTIGKTYSLAELKKVLEEIGFTTEDATAIRHYPHPDALVRGIVDLLHRLSRGKLDSKIRSTLSFLDRLEGSRVKYLTGRYIAVKAVKHEPTRTKLR